MNQTKREVKRLQRERASAIPEVGDDGEPKWQVSIRLFSPSQSIRNEAIRCWNQRLTWIRIFTVSNDTHAVDVEFTYHDAVSLQAVGPMGYHAACMFVAAMNIGSAGLWWWHRVEQNDKFYQRLTDLKAPPGMMPDPRIHASPRLEWERKELDDCDLQRVALCFGMIARLGQSMEAIVQSYLTGLALLAKSDVHLSFAPQASQQFATCLFEAMRYLGQWDGNDDRLQETISGVFATVFKRSDEEKRKVLDDLRQLRRETRALTGITLERAAVLKVLCDAYLSRQLERMAVAETNSAPSSGL